MGVDGIALLLAALTSFLLPVVLIASWTDIQKRVRSYLFFMMALQTGMLGAFFALNLFLFYVFWETMLIPMYFIIGIWGGPRRVYATVKFFIYTMVGSLLMLVGIVVLAWLHQQQFGSLTFEYYGVAPASGLLDLSIPTEGGAWWQRQGFLFGVFALAFAIKVPMFPFHTWLPDAHVEAPTPGSAVLAGVLLKLGTFGFVRYALPLFPQAAVDVRAVDRRARAGRHRLRRARRVGAEDVKKLVAYSSVSHMGFIVLGLFALNPQGVTGAVLQMVNHGVSTGALFILVGMIYERRHVRDLDAFGGLARVMPVFAAFFVIATMSSVGLPGLNGFVGEFLILLGAFSSTGLGGGDRDERRDPLGGVHAVGGAARVLRSARARGEQGPARPVAAREAGRGGAGDPDDLDRRPPVDLHQPDGPRGDRAARDHEPARAGHGGHPRGPRGVGGVRGRGGEVIPQIDVVGGRADDAGGARRAGPAACSRCS